MSNEPNFIDFRDEEELSFFSSGILKHMIEINIFLSISFFFFQKYEIISQFPMKI